jgi:hypothetical protein
MVNTIEKGIRRLIRNLQDFARLFQTPRNLGGRIVGHISEGSETRYQDLDEPISIPKIMGFSEADLSY